ARVGNCQASIKAESPSSRMGFLRWALKKPGGGFALPGLRVTLSIVQQYRALPCAFPDDLTAI
ncbi:hypothetical protein, partial [Leclercia sp. M-A074-M]